jgi:GT2 family glycosyltransferase
MNASSGRCQNGAMISFIIKTYNEEKKIAACIESVLAAANCLPNPYEIIVADSVSADKTIQVAALYPVTIVQFKNPEDRGCGAGVQLGYQHSSGDLVFLLDGDMTLQPDFLPIALETLKNDERLGGVAGLVKEVAIRNTFDELRVSSGASSTARDEAWLNGGGLYRRKAITTAGGYAANRNLKGWEEAELGMRLRSAGWHLRRIAIVAVRHDGHAMDTRGLLLKHWRSRRLMSNGIILKSALAKPWLIKAVTLLVHPLAVALSWLSILILMAVPSWGWKGDLFLGISASWILIFILLALKKKSVTGAMSSVVIWHVNAAALLYGLFLPTSAPTTPISSKLRKG